MSTAEDTRKATVRTPEQMEFRELFEKLVKTDSSWTRAKVSQYLNYAGRAAITRILKGEQNISIIRLQKMRELVKQLCEQHAQARKHVAQIEAKSQPFEDLEYLREHAPAAFESARSMISVLKENAQQISSTAFSPTVESAMGAAATAQRLAQESGRKRKAAAPNADTPGPSAGAGKVSK